MSAMPATHWQTNAEARGFGHGARRHDHFETGQRNRAAFRSDRLQCETNGDLQRTVLITGKLLEFTGFQVELRARKRLYRRVISAARYRRQQR